MIQILQWMLPTLLAALVVPTGAAAQPSGGAERLGIEVGESCAEGKRDELVAALRARVDGMEIAFGAFEEPVLRWRSENGRCVLELVRGDGVESPPTLELGQEADATEVRNAASRIAWLLNTRRPPAPPPEPESTPEEEAPAQEEQSPEESDQQQPTEQESTEEEPPEETEPEESPSEDVFNSGNRMPVRMAIVPQKSYPESSPEKPVPSYAVNLIGRNYGLAGFEIGVIFNTERAFADGAQLATLGNWVSGPMRGLQASFGLNVAAGWHRGLSLAGLANVSGDLRGGAMSGLGNLTIGDTNGVQAAAGINWTTGDTEGLQFGAVNVSGDVDGMQAGAINVGREVTGLQMGLLNIAKQSNASVGLLNINWARPAYLMGWMNETGLMSVGLKHGSRHFFNIFRVGYAPFGSPDLLVPGFGLGGHFSIAGTTSYVDVDLLYNVAIPPAQTNTAPGHWNQMRLTFGVMLTRRIGLYAGGSLNTIYSEGERVLQPPASMPSSDGGNGVAFWPGFFGGAHF